jgi:hypothetical protein
VVDDGVAVVVAADGMDEGAGVAAGAAHAANRIVDKTSPRTERIIGAS